jgi:hypothetical protein
LDTLQQEVPYFAEREFSWDIYTRDISFGDPTGEKIRGIKAYQTFFSTLRALRSIMYSDVQVTKNKIRYDWNGKRIIVRWQSTWTMKGARKPAYVDAVSYLSLNDKGLIYKHELDNVNINGQDVNPNYAAGFVGMQELAVAGMGKVPSYGFDKDSEEAKHLPRLSSYSDAVFSFSGLMPRFKSICSGESDKPGIVTCSLAGEGAKAAFGITLFFPDLCLGTIVSHSVKTFLFVDCRSLSLRAADILEGSFLGRVFELKEPSKAETKDSALSLATSNADCLIMVKWISPRNATLFSVVVRSTTVNPFSAQSHFAKPAKEIAVCKSLSSTSAEPQCSWSSILHIVTGPARADDNRADKQHA